MLAHEQKTIGTQIECYHCGLKCPDDSVALGDKFFCCTGCRAVYQFLNENALDDYYKHTVTPGARPDQKDASRFEFLDDSAIVQRLLDFSDDTSSRVTLRIPQIHCTSCVWLLENLYRVRPGILMSTVNFVRKELTAVFDPRTVTLRQLVELLARIGYEPELNLGSLHEKPQKNPNRSLYIKIGVAGFAFGNIMLLSLPEYLGDVSEGDMAVMFQLLSLALALPVLFYSASDYFKSAFSGLRQGVVSIDVPIVIGMLVLIARSIYEILYGTGVGYLDSFTGLTLFLLVGKLFQRKTYDRLSFDRDYRSYFPISVIRKSGDNESTVPVTNLSVGDRIVIRNREIVPADSILIDGDASIDYSFVTGESEPRELRSGDRVLAGGRQIGGAIELDVIKDVSQSYLTSLWNNDVFTKSSQTGITSVANAVAKYFTAAILLIAIAAAIYWIPRDVPTAINAVTSILIIACPCTLALSSPFVLGTAIRLLGKDRFYLRNTSVVESIAGIDTIVFDKTGTLSYSDQKRGSFEGSILSNAEKNLVASLARQSTHPASRHVLAYIDADEHYNVSQFINETGKGISGRVNGHDVRLGRADWVTRKGKDDNPNPHGVHLSIDNIYRGRFVFESKIRDGLDEAIGSMSKSYKLAMISGDSDRDDRIVSRLFGSNSQIAFEQSPHDKLDFVKSLQSEGARVMMVGDGLNDGGALKAADVGIAVTENTSSFSPSSDGILDSGSLLRLHKYLKFSKRCLVVIITSFVLSFLYNAVGLSYAFSGRLSPLVSAILMPLSSITVVLYATMMTKLQARLTDVT